MEKKVKFSFDAAGLLPVGMFLLFLFLKLTDKIDWSWWYVTMPLWAVPVAIIGLLIFLLIGWVFIELFR